MTPYRKAADPRPQGHRAMHSEAVRRSLTDARRRRGWSFPRAARETGISLGHLEGLEAGRWRCSTVVARLLVATLKLSMDDAAALLDEAAVDAGRSRPGRWTS